MTSLIGDDVMNFGRWIANIISYTDMNILVKFHHIKVSRTDFIRKRNLPRFSLADTGRSQSRDIKVSYLKK